MIKVWYMILVNLGLFVIFFFQAEDGVRDKATWLEFRRVLFRSLRKNLDETEAMDIVNQKKTTPFKSLLSRPKKEDVDRKSVV